MLTFKVQEMVTRKRIYRWGYNSKQRWWVLIFAVDKNGRQRRLVDAERMGSEGEAMSWFLEK